METLLMDILAALRGPDGLDDEGLDKLLRYHSKLAPDPATRYSKKKVLPFYLRVKAEEPGRWQSWGIDENLEARLFSLLRMKPRRTASGVATITVITKPWTCSNDCLYCPNDLRMPKSYLHAEPACQRAERNFFDPYLQVVSRLRALTEMGHPCDKVELIVLGGSWSDYPLSYQVWFISELFRAVNDGAATQEKVELRREAYRELGISSREEELAAYVAEAQERIDAGTSRYNREASALYGNESPWERAAEWQEQGFDELQKLHRENETASHRVVGLVIETRPAAITAENLHIIRRLGCTKVQVGVQSLRDDVLAMNERVGNVAQVQRAFELLRVFGFKIHSHFMANLYGSTPAEDVQDYRKFMNDAAFMPDEVKLYPCALIGGTRLVSLYERGAWQPYGEEELIDVLVEDIVATPCFCRVSRMIRDFSAGDILVGNKKTNLRQLVEKRIADRGLSVDEIRYRELGTETIPVDELRLDVFSYETSATSERFLQWVGPAGEIAGFCRLSMPNQDFVAAHAGELPVGIGEAMIREVHVYGAAAKIHKTGSGVQHLGLGRQLVNRACEIAAAEGFKRINVISAVGTRGYYEKLGFVSMGLYHQKELV